MSKYEFNTEFFKRIPKTDLHVHLDGSLRLGTLIELSKQGKHELPSYTEDGLRKLVFKETYEDLPDYLHGFMYTGAIMRTAENLERIAYELAQDNIEEGVRYIEVRFAPQLHATKDLKVTDVIKAVSRGLEKAAKEHNASKAVKDGADIPFHFGLITCAMRRFAKGFAPYYAELLHALGHAPQEEVFSAASLELARTITSCIMTDNLPIVGFDLAGEEAGYPAVDHKEAYQYCHDHFIRKTVHAGEAYGPESIFQAITQCHANRIGHGTFLFATDKIQDPKIEYPHKYVEDLANYIATQRIGIEVCVTSNIQTIPAISSFEDHPVKKMIDYGLSVSICTDNRLISNTSVTREMELLAKTHNLSFHAIQNLAVAGFKGSFFPGNYTEKRAFVRAVIDRFRQLEAEFAPKKK